MRNIHIIVDVTFHVPLISVIQELMQTDLHRVIRTQKLTDDHCQVRAQAFVFVGLPPDHRSNSTSYIKSSGHSSPFMARISSIEI